MELSDVLAYIHLLVFLCILLYVSMCVYVCDYVRASVSGLLRPFLCYGFIHYNLHSFVHSVLRTPESLQPCRHVNIRFQLI